MRYGRSFVTMIAAGTLALGGCDDDSGNLGPAPGPEPTNVIRSAGDLTAALAEFRSQIGDPANGGGAGPQPAGRREIKWDGVPADRTNTDDFPTDFFNTNVKSGLITTTDGIGFRVSDNDFADVNPGYADEFESLSKVKTFMSSGSPRMTLAFRVAGTDAPGLVNGVGIVFSDVDRDGSAHITLYDASGANLGKFEAPVRTDAAGHSFVGAVFAEPIVARVEVTSGGAALAAGTNDITDGGTQDLVVTDDFLYGEPQAAE